MATHSSSPSWKIPWTEEPGHKELDMTEVTWHACTSAAGLWVRSLFREPRTHILNVKAKIIKK